MALTPTLPLALINQLRGGCAAGTIYNAIVQGMVDVQNLSEMLAEQPDLTDSKGAPPLPCTREDPPPSVEFRDVVFHYPAQDPAAGLRDVSFTADGGRTTAVVRIHKLLPLSEARLFTSAAGGSAVITHCD